MVLDVFRFKKYGNSNELGVWVCGLAVLEGSARYPSSLVALSLNTNRVICPSCFILGVNQTWHPQWGTKPLKVTKKRIDSVFSSGLRWSHLCAKNADGNFKRRSSSDARDASTPYMVALWEINLEMIFQRSIVIWTGNKKKEKRCPGLFWQTRIIHLNEHEVGPSSSQRRCLKHHLKIM